MFLSFTAQLLMFYLNFFHDLNTTTAFLSPVDAHSIINHFEISHIQVSQDFVSKSLEITDSIKTEAHHLYGAIRQATVTKRVNGALAGIVAEVAAGSAGALISREASIAMIGIDGKKRDSLETKMMFTGAYFGANFLTEDISRVCLGIPRPFALLLATIVGAVVSTSVKAEGRLADEAVVSACKEAAVRRGYYCIGGEFIMNLDVPIRHELRSEIQGRRIHDVDLKSDLNTGNNDRSNLPSRSVSTKSFFENASATKSGTIQDFCPVFYTTDDHVLRVEENIRDRISFPEVAGDICKWMVFDTLISNTPWTTHGVSFNPAEITFLHVIYGAIAAVAGKYLQDLTPPKDNKPINYGQIAMEGGVLFGTYKGTLTFLNAVIPDDWNKRFLFESILSKMEEIF
eukprot:CAMPEP_0119040522 /NCGR_PEP_ID=MMETSP1177-20130426/10473_1 /TAXON_ID=2985 /ORGANISM="Ochromonas sp, Strain CCMP1899" /LENGTH=399 /DNA_ID=CAMNT_0007005651 /DNA_START=75 /DNA_END=1274 /DNA_ORIENTATION=+